MMDPPAPQPEPAEAFDFTRPAFRRDPYETYRQLRESSPLHCVERDGTRFWVLTRHADIVAVLRDARMSVERPLQPKVPPALSDADRAALHPVARALRVFARVMLFRDPPDHTRLRGLASKAFTPRMVEALRPRIAAIIDELLASLEPGTPFDVVAELAEPLPILVIAELLGLPASDRKDLKRWSDDLAAMLVMGAGHETTTNLIGNGVLACVRHPEAWAQLHSEPGLLPSAVEEMLRYDAPVQATSRVATVPFSCHGRTIPPGEEIGLLLGAANRDPAVFDAPDRFDLRRADNRHVSFGFGIHFCLGAGLARLEAQLALRGLLARATTLAATCRDDDLEWRPGWLLRGLVRLPIRG